MKARVTRIAEKLGQQTRLQIALLAVAGHGALCVDASCVHACPADPDEFDAAGSGTGTEGTAEPLEAGLSR